MHVFVWLFGNISTSEHVCFYRESNHARQRDVGEPARPIRRFYQLCKRINGVKDPIGRELVRATSLLQQSEGPPGNLLSTMPKHNHV